MLLLVKFIVTRFSILLDTYVAILQSNSNTPCRIHHSCKRAKKYINNERNAYLALIHWFSNIVT